MARELVKKDIDGREYEFSQFGAKQGVRTLIRLGKIIGKPLALGFGAVSKGSEESMLDRKVDGEMLGEAVEALMKNADEKEVLELLELLCANCCTCEGAKIDFNAHYEGDYALMMKVARAALEVQYGNFIDALIGIGAIPVQKPKSQPIQARNAQQM